jgi:flagellar basal-body rod modification protein FlgD
MSTAPVVPTPPTTPTTSGLPTGQSLNNMFLQLLVAQLQNQDPTSPVDPSQFVGQLAQFSELSEVTSIYTLLQGFVPASGSTGAGSSDGTLPTSGNSSAGANSPLSSLLNPGVNPTANLTANSLAPAAAAAASTFLPAAVPSAAPTLPNFSAPSLSALTSKIQGVF